MRNVLTISRHWNNPEIKTSITNESISLSMDIEDFKKALKQELSLYAVFTKEESDAFIERLKKEISSVTWVFTEKEFSKRVDAAKQKVLKETEGEFDKRLDASIAKIIKGVKEESIKAV